MSKTSLTLLHDHIVEPHNLKCLIYTPWPMVIGGYRAPTFPRFLLPKGHRSSFLLHIIFHDSSGNALLLTATALVVVVNILKILLVIVVAFASGELGGGDPKARLTTGGVLGGKVKTLALVGLGDLGATLRELTGTGREL